MENSQPTEIFVARREPPLRACVLAALRVTLRTLYTLAVIGGCTYLVFWRAESGWLFLPAALLVVLFRPRD